MSKRREEWGSGLYEEDRENLLLVYVDSRCVYVLCGLWRDVPLQQFCWSEESRVNWRALSKYIILHPEGVR